MEKQTMTKTSKTEKPISLAQDIYLTKDKTLRQWYAGLAIQGLLAYGAERFGGLSNEAGIAKIAELSFKYADAMLKENRRTE